MSEKLIRTKNLEESPYIQLQQKNNFHHNIHGPTPQYSLTQRQDNIEWSIHTPKQFFDQSAIDIPDKGVREIINQIIAEMKEKEKTRQLPTSCKKLVAMIKKNTDIIKQYAEKGFAKAIVVGYFAENSLADKNFGGFVQKLQIITQKCMYPYAQILMGRRFVGMFEKTPEKGEKYFRKALLYGEPLAYLSYGSYFTQIKKYHKAYEMYKNAELHNLKPNCYLNLALLFVKAEDNTFPSSCFIAKKYFTLADQVSRVQNAYDDFFRQAVQDRIRYNEQIAEEIKSTLETQSKIVANFINTRFKQVDRIKQIEIYGNSLFNFSSTSNLVAGQEQHGLSFKKKLFYVVFAPHLIFPSRGFLAEEENGNIESINIYNWDRIPLKKLKLLHKLGTKVILHEYIRKYGANDQLPIYRVQNPASVEIIENKEKHYISDAKYREFAKELFSRKLYDQAMYIYQHLVRKEASELQAIYSNMGLVHKNKGNIIEAKKCYRESLKIKKYLKSQIRLANIYLDEGNLKEAEKLAFDVDDQFDEKQQLLTKIKKLKEKIQFEHKDISEKQFEKIDISKIPYTKKSYKFIPQILRYQSPTLNKSCSEILTGDAQRYLIGMRSFIEKNLKLSPSLSNSKYMETIQSIYDSAECKFSDKNLDYIQKFFELAYLHFESFKPKQVFFQQALGYIWHYNFQMVSKPLLQVLMTVQFAGSLAMRCNFLERRIQDYCYELEKQGKIEGAMKIYKCSKSYCLPFCRKISECLILLNRHEQNVKYVDSVLPKLLLLEVIPNAFKTILHLCNQKMKSLIILKKYTEAINYGEQLIKIVQNKNPGLINYYVALKDPQDFMLDWFEKTKRCYRSNIEDQKYIALKNNIALACHLAKDDQRALTYINLEDISKKIGKNQIYYSSLLLKLKISISKGQYDRNYFKNLLENSLKSLKQIGTQRWRKTYECALLKYGLDIELSSHNFASSFDYCRRIVKINARYSLHIIKKLGRYLANHQDKTQKFCELIKKEKELQIIWQQLQSKLKIYFRRRVYEEKRKLEKIQQISDFLEQKATQILEEVVKQKEGQEEKLEEFIVGNIEEFKKEYMQLFEEKEEQTQLEWEEEAKYEENYEGFFYNNYFEENKNRYVVFFHEKINLQTQQAQKFNISAQKLCYAEKGLNGIKIAGEEVRLKINGGARLVGKLKQHSTNEYHLFFLKREGHDDYRRKK